jgi:hypothetical protein
VTNLRIVSPAVNAVVSCPRRSNNTNPRGATQYSTYERVAYIACYAKFLSAVWPALCKVLVGLPAYVVERGAVSC